MQEPRKEYLETPEFKYWVEKQKLAKKKKKWSLKRWEEKWKGIVSQQQELTHRKQAVFQEWGNADNVKYGWKVT